MDFLKSTLVVLFYIVPITLCSQITYQSAFPNIDFEFPVEIQSPTDTSDRLFVVEQRGRIKVFDRSPDVAPSQVSTFLDITDRVSFSSGQEIGLLGLTFHPDYEQNGYFYVYYTANSEVPGVNYKVVLSRFSVSGSDDNVANVNSELILFQFDKNQPQSNHNGGKIAFGLDGYLYISIGDGGGGNDPELNAQNINSAFGSICRIDVDVDGSNPLETNPDPPNGNYEIPSNNPLVGVNGLDEIYAYGIRNTWKFSFDRANGRLWGADVGQSQFEEINIIENGQNYGWSRFEGLAVANSGVTISEPTTFPIFTYGRSQGDRSITGGYVYRGSEITSLNPDINSKYIFGDYISGRVWALDYNATTETSSRTLLFQTSNQFISSFGVDKNGELYFSDYGSNAKLYILVDGTTPPSGTPVNGIGEWQGLANGSINGIVNSIATTPDGNVYHGGNFTLEGNSSVKSVAVWNETTGWQGLGTGTDGTINAIKIAPNGDIYAAGVFSEIDGVSATNIAVWNGSNWGPVGNGIEGSIAALEIDANGNVYAGGIFEELSGESFRNIAVWNGTSWNNLMDLTTMISGTNNEVRSLAMDGSGVLYVGGNFDEAGGNTANRIATWNGSNWGTLGSGTSGFVEAIATTPSNIYVGGNFAIAGGITVNRIAKWSTTNATWSALDNGLSNSVNSLIHDGTNLYAAGNFNLANTDTTSIIVNNIAQWNASNGWRALGTNTNVGVDVTINAIEFAKDLDGFNKLYAGGNFSTAGSNNAENTAQWLSNVLTVEGNDVHNYELYPNPTSSIITFGKVYNWVLIDSSGKILDVGKSEQLSLESYASGLYFLKIDHKATLKIIKN